MVILLLAFALRFHLLGAQSLWNDEGNSYVQATRSFADIAAHAARDIHPPGYYWLLKIWMAFTGETEFALRALSAFASLLSIAFAYALGRRLFSPIAGLAAALFITLNTFHITYAQEARMYALLALWGVMGMWALVGFLSPHKRPEVQIRWAAALALVNAAGLWTQYAYPFMMLVQGVVFVVFTLTLNPSPTRGEGLKRASQRPLSLWQRSVPAGERAGVRWFSLYIAANLLSIALYLPWLPGAWAQITTWPNTGVGAGIGEAVGMLLGWFTFGVTYTEKDPSWMAVALVLLAFGLRAQRDTWRRILIPVVWALLPVAVFLALGLFREANLKLLLPAQIGFALWLGRGVWAVWSLEMPPRAGFAPLPRLAVIAALAGISLTMWGGLDSLYHAPAYQRDDYRAIARDITDALRPGAAIILNAPNQQEVFGYYYEAAAPVYPLPARLGGDDDATRAAVEAIISDHTQVFAVYWGEAERDPRRIVEGALTQGAYEISSAWYGDVRLVRYATPTEPALTQDSGTAFGDHITLDSYALSAQAVAPGDVLQVRLNWRTDSALQTRYKVFVQLLNPDGTLAAQRDNEPGGGMALTTTWPPGEIIPDQHALLIPDNLSPANYSLIIGLYNIDNPQERLAAGASDYLILSEITIGNAAE